MCGFRVCAICDIGVHVDVNVHVDSIVALIVYDVVRNGVYVDVGVVFSRSC